MTTRGETAVVVIAAGAGTRMRSATPKVLHSLGGRSMLAHVLLATTAVKPTHVVVVIGSGRELVAAEVQRIGERAGARISIAVQEEQLGTGHAVGCGLAGLP